MVDVDDRQLNKDNVPDLHMEEDFCYGSSIDEFAFPTQGNQKRVIAQTAKPEIRSDSAIATHGTVDLI